MGVFMVKCPYCGNTDDVDESCELKTTECRSCGKTFGVPRRSPAIKLAASRRPELKPPPILLLSETAEPEPEPEPPPAPPFGQLARRIAAGLLLAALVAGVAVWRLHPQAVEKAVAKGAARIAITREVLQESFDKDRDFLYHGCRVQEVTLTQDDAGDHIQVKFERNGKIYDRLLNVTYEGDGKFNYAIDDYNRHQDALAGDADLLWDKLITRDKEAWRGWEYLSAKPVKPNILHYEAKNGDQTCFFEYEIGVSGAQITCHAVDSSFPPLTNLIGENCAKNGSMEAAVQFYKRAAQQGLVRAQCNLIRCQIRGEGMPKDPETAFFRARKLARNGAAEAQFLLGQMFENGIGCDRNSEQAYFWYQEAEKRGYRAQR